ISALGNLAYYCSICPKASKIFERKLRTLSSGDKQAKRIRESVSEICKDASCLKKMLCFVSFLFLVDNRIDHDLFIDLFSKTILFSKSRPEDFVIKICDKGLSRISSESFHNLLLPNIKKSLLRSPEIAVFGVVRVIESIKFSIDDCFSDLLNGLSPCLTSTSEELSSTAVSVVVKMASKVEAPATEKVVGYLMELLSGARSPEQRVIILEGLAKCGVTDEEDCVFEKIASSVVTKLATPDIEGNEIIVTAQWNVVVAWAKRLPQNSQALITVFKNAPLFHSSVRHIGYRSLAKIFTICKLKTIPSDSEPAIVAAVMKLGSSNYDKVWNAVIEYNGFLKDKVLSQVGTEDAVVWVELAEKVMLERPSSDSLTTYPPLILKTITILLFWPSWQVRKRAGLCLERILRIEKARFAEALASEIFTETINGSVDQTFRKVKHNQSDSSLTVPGEWYVQVLRQLLLTEGPELDELAIHTLLLASVQRLVEVDGSVWLRWMHSQGR
ncbi:hypothetical protein KIN20_000001, partial [Parelaphostrongylus tenuis]